MRCPTCNGKGDTGPAPDPDPCNVCRGTGEIAECSLCGGECERHTTECCGQSLPECVTTSQYNGTDEGWYTFCEYGHGCALGEEWIAYYNIEAEGLDLIAQEERDTGGN